MADPNVPVPADGEGEPTNYGDELEMKLNNVAGKVKAKIVNRIRKLVDQNPQAFVNGMRAMYLQKSEDGDYES